MSAPSESLSSRYTKAISYTTLASVFTRFSGVIISVLIARFLGSSALGLYAIVLSTTSAFSGIFSFGLNLTCEKEIAANHHNNPQRAGQVLTFLSFSLLFSILIAGVVYFFSLPFVSSSIYSLPELSRLLKFAFCLFILILINQFLDAVFSGLQAFKQLMFINSLLSLINIPLVLIALFFGNSNQIIFLIAAYTVSSFLRLLFLLFSIPKELRKYNINLSLTNLRSLIKPVLLDFSFPAYLTKIMEQPLTWLTLALLVSLGGNTSLVGGLNVITTIKGWILHLPSLFASILISLFSFTYQARSLDVFNKSLMINQRFLWLSTLPLVVFFISVFRPMIHLLFGESYSIFWHAGVILLLWCVLQPVNEVNDRAMIAMGKMWVSLFFRIVYFIIFFIMLFLLVPIYHLTGYVIANGVAYLIYVLIQTMWLVLHLRLSPGFYFPLSFLTILFLLLALLVVNFSPYLVSLILGLLLFVSVALIEWFWIATREEKSIVFECLRRVFRSHEKENAIS